MTYEVIISLAAALDIEQAVSWYDHQSEGLGDRLKSNLYESLTIIGDNPLICAKRYRDVRVRYLKSFPYGIHYLIEENQVKVFGFFHTKRNPNMWIRRLQ